MLISTYTILALRCSKCGKMELSSLSRFSCGKNGQIELFCECGHSLFVFSRKGRNLYDLQVECLVCEKKHALTLQGEEIWNKHIRPLTCENTGIKLGYLGKREKVLQAIQQDERTVRELINEVFAESIEDLEKLQAMKNIKLEANSCRYLDGKWLKKKNKVKNK